jgi:Uncharacterized conserved protein
VTRSSDVDACLAALDDWRGETLSRIRDLIHQTDPSVAETVKWRKPSNPLGVPTWEQAGILCTGEAYRDKVKLTFAHGAALDDPTTLFNASLTGGTRRAIDLSHGQMPDAQAFKALVQAAISHNRDKKGR